MPRMLRSKILLEKLDIKNQKSKCSYKVTKKFLFGTGFCFEMTVSNVDSESVGTRFDLKF